ncbi:SDR family NAD(P)-dependent oxidoreductase [Actinophytocola algeriensis]|jgi:NAD(P)-dependent dehydrogenase (short-subunit alcohol dehydrogenase family)|uniref:NAD(P)-dependent dehydrogenase (Short-subunit alcohol dehydrogenase family) n=1 Tax=Actinophytocola algeriensis TaxID=1768010 RepID=A0A7W7Q8L7_9PSEU|nr:SDR family NAD(P)-dependent oxidoreductase [Actinophytocola algeriensis]MBB4908636.1 NAD(P)-dependent dehydrogenase (short-subunit alcohol dehydrogenase family) [Actinophytocola algeriensis]MBE1474977.1 NAD(P)-dependent dehydrogenase (short-subunit alcohol dehydrogenase family) [Actinophytocola algeriensis]
MAEAAPERDGPPVALVTGATGGIGAVLCADLAEAGYAVVAADLTGAPAPGATHEVELDLRDGEACRAAVRSTVDRFGRLDLLVNNAGINARGTFDEMPEEVWGEVVDVNLNGTLRMCQAAHPALAAGRDTGRDTSGGAIVNLASTGGLVAIAGSAVYGITKAAIIHLTKVLALEWAGAGIRVNAVAPTIVPSPMTADVLGNDDYMTAKLATIPLGRIVEPQEVADAVRWLASAGSGMVTGQTIAVDGGVSVL